MSILDQFYILFASNAKDVKTDMEAAAKATDNFEEQLKKADKTSADLGLSFEKLALAGVAALEGFASLGKLKDAIIQQVDYNAEIEKTSILTNVNARELSIWNGVVARAGGNPGSKEYLNFIRSLNQQYAGLGINQRIAFVNRDLGAIADKIKSLNDLNPGSGYALAQQLKIGDDLYLALKDGKAALDDNIAEMAKLDNTTQKTTENALKLKQAWVGVDVAISSAWNNLTAGAVTALTALGNIFTSLFKGDFKTAFDTWRNTGSTGSGTPSSTPGATPTASTGAPRGIRNNNPGNIEGLHFGATGLDSGGFAQYATLSDGLHAEDRQLQIYGQRGIDTIAAIAAKWAPAAAGNNVQAYIAALKKSTGFDANTPLNLNDPAVRAKIAAAINQHENGAAYGDLANQQIAPLAAAAQSGIAQADATPFNGVQSTPQKTLTIGSITINTQATDADGIAKDLNGALDRHFAETIGSYDDGVDY